MTIDAQSRVVPTGGTTEVTATVIESSGTPVQNGTLVRFTTTLGRMDPVEAQTRNGIAVTTFIAGNDSGVAEVRATSGGAGGGSDDTTPPATALRRRRRRHDRPEQQRRADRGWQRRRRHRHPSRESGHRLDQRRHGYADRDGRRPRVAVLLPGISVSFSANRGTLSSSSAVTDANGEARVTLTTNADTSVTATAGSKTSTPATTITAQAAAGGPVDVRGRRRHHLRDSQRGSDGCLHRTARYRARRT